MRMFSSLEDPEIIRLLADGAVGIIPTDTVYGLVCSAMEPNSVDRVFKVKLREHNPGTILAGTVDQLVSLGMKRRYLQAVEHFWPNPLSVIIPCDDSLEYLHMGLRSLAVRIPADEELRVFLEQVGVLMTTSANQPGEPVAQTVEEAQAYFDEAVDFYVDGGDLRGRPPSTIIRIVDDAIEIIREGALKINENGEINEA